MPDARHLTWAFLVTSLVVGVAALVRVADPTALGTDDLTGVIRLPAMVMHIVTTLFGLAVLVFLVGVFRRMTTRRRDAADMGAGVAEEPRRPAWLQALAQILSLVNFLAFAFLLWKNVLPFTGLAGSNAGGFARGVSDETAVSAPFFITLTVGGLALVAAVCALALAIWFTAGHRFAAWLEHDDETPTRPPLAEAIDESLDDLRVEPDARRAIIRCYARFERAAAASGLPRMAWHTPMEFMRDALARLPLPRDAVRALTGLFELARFSDHALGADERERAMHALDDIKAAIDGAR